MKVSAGSMATSRSCLPCWFSVSRQELVSHLHQQLAEQKRLDMTTSGTAIQPEVSALQNVVPNKDVASTSDVQLVLPGDTKKQRKQVKQIFLDRGNMNFLRT
jgi:eukaryotic translation initiation factor 2-alpha kinase 4